MKYMYLSSDFKKILTGEEMPGVKEKMIEIMLPGLKNRHVYFIRHKER